MTGFFDLNVPWTPNEAETQRTLVFLNELGYNVVALSHTLTGKLQADLTCPIPKTLPFRTPSKLRILRRCTLPLTDPSQNHRVSSLSSHYDIVALRPTNEKTLQQACSSLDCDMISLDMTTRYDFHPKMSTLGQAVERGIMIELCYGPGILCSDSMERRNVVSNAIQLIRAARGRGLIISSEAAKAAGCRAPADVVNLAATWGLGQERAREAISKLARTVVVSAGLRRTSYRGAVELVYGGEKPAPAASQAGENDKKRKAEDSQPGNSGKQGLSMPPSIRELKRQKKAAKLQHGGKPAEGTNDTNKINTTEKA
ncbi:MAG: hypothetical protein M1831_000927 [Alyxoria varia]|nr:MAG: hypothetical protein M1831_000927 [Alyxoria varia]